MDGEAFLSYRDLKVWREAMALAVSCYELTRAFPKEEMYGMTSQIRRASASIAANIAEGHGRETTASFIYLIENWTGVAEGIGDAFDARDESESVDIRPGRAFDGSMRGHRADVARVRAFFATADRAGEKTVTFHSLFAIRYSQAEEC
jgi:hypothetical protein